jgi:ATP-dependent DNA helicase RecG
VTYAALVLFGTHKALGRHLAQSEVVFEWRLREGATKYDRRTEYREGFFLFHNRLWQEIDARNQVHQYQDGLFRKEIPTFREDVIREAILNAVSHRDYRKAGSIFVRQWPTRIEIISSGGFPDGVTSENILWKQNPRNRRLADAFARCGLVERSGQGADLMYEWSARDAKPLPDYTHSDPHEVWLSLDGQVQDDQFIKFLEKLAKETGTTFGTEELFALSCIREGKIIPERLRKIVAKLRVVGAVELSGRKNTLSSRFYKKVGRPGEYTRLKGLDRDTNKELILKHLEQTGKPGAPLSELWQVLPHLSRDQIRTIVKRLRQDGKIHSKGKTKSSRWFIGSNDSDEQ